MSQQPGSSDAEQKAAVFQQHVKQHMHYLRQWGMQLQQPPYSQITPGPPGHLVGHTPGGQIDLDVLMNSIEQIPEAAPQLFRPSPLLFNPQMIHSVLFENLHANYLHPPPNNNLPELSTTSKGASSSHGRDTNRPAVDMVTQLLLGMPTDVPLTPAGYSAPLVDREALMGRLDSSIKVALATAASVSGDPNLVRKEDGNIAAEAAASATTARRGFQSSSQTTAIATPASTQTPASSSADSSQAPIVPRAFTEQAAQLISDSLLVIMADVLSKLSQASEQSRGVGLLKIAQEGEVEGTEAIVAATSDPQGVFDSLNELARYRERILRSTGEGSADMTTSATKASSDSSEMTASSSTAATGTTTETQPTDTITSAQDSSTLATMQRPRRAFDDAVEAAFGLGSRRRPRPAAAATSTTGDQAGSATAAAPESLTNEHLLKTFPTNLPDKSEITLGDFITVLERDPILARSHALKVARLTHEQTVRRDDNLF